MRARFLVGRWERRSELVGMDSGMGSDMVGGSMDMLETVCVVCCVLVLYSSANRGSITVSHAKPKVKPIRMHFSD